jgi:hypothetical protein
MSKGGGTYSIPEIIFSYSSHHGTWLSFFAFSISLVSFVVAAIVTGDEKACRRECARCL